MSDTYTVFKTDGTSFVIPSKNVDNVRRLLAGQINYIQKDEEPIEDIEEALNEPLIKSDDYTLSELKKLAVERFDLTIPKNIKKADLLELVNNALS
jgi:hypothetical protein